MKFRYLLLLTATMVSLPDKSSAEVIYGLTGNNELVTFDSSTPGLFGSTVAISGARGDILNIDFRPATGELFGLDAGNNLYTLNISTGLASFVGSTGIVGGFDYGFDFNPVPDRIRLALDTAQNFRLNPADGSVTIDGNFSYIAGDPNLGTLPTLSGAAYTNNVPGALTTQLFVLDHNLNTLAVSTDPNAGLLSTVGTLGLDFTGLLGFDISGVTGIAYASLSTDGVTSSLYMIDLTNGQLQALGQIGQGATILDISVTPIPEPATTILPLALLSLAFFRRRFTSPHLS